MVLASASNLSGSSVRTPRGGEGQPKVRCRWTLKFVHLCSHCFSVCGSSMHSGHVGSSAGSTKWAYALRSGVHPNCRRVLRTEPAPLYTSWRFEASWAGRSEMVRGMRTFAVSSEIGRGGVSVAVAANLSAASLLSMSFWSGIQMKMVGPFLLSTCWRIDWVSCVPL